MEGMELSSREKQIFETLSHLNSLKTLYSLEQSEKKNYRSLLENLLNSIEEYVTPENKDLELIIQIYNILQETDKRLKIAQLFEDNTINVVLSYNLAYCYQNTGDPKNTLTFGTIAIVELESLLKTKKCEKRNANCRIRLSKFLANVYLQATALHSQLKEHSKALRLAEQGLEQICETVLLIKENVKIEGEMTKLYHYLFEFASKIISEKQEKEEGADQKTNHHFRPMSWIHNSDNLKRFLVESKLEGIEEKFNAEWLMSFSISDLMFLKLQSVQDLSSNHDLFENNHKFAIECINLLAAACFSVSTEKRIMAQNEARETLEPPSSETPPARSTKIIDFKTQCLLKKSKKFQESEHYYLKSIEVLGKFLESSLILSYLISNFSKNYGISFNHITEEEEQSYTASRICLSGQKQPQQNFRESHESLKPKHTGPTNHSSQPRDIPTEEHKELIDFNENSPISNKSNFVTFGFKKKRNPSEGLVLHNEQNQISDSFENNRKKQLYKQLRQQNKLAKSNSRWNSSNLTSRFPAEKQQFKSELAAFFKKTKDAFNLQMNNKTISTSRMKIQDSAPLTDRIIQKSRPKQNVLNPSFHTTMVKRTNSQFRLQPEEKQKFLQKISPNINSVKSIKVLEPIFGNNKLREHASPQSSRHERCQCCHKQLFGFNNMDFCLNKLVSPNKKTCLTSRENVSSLIKNNQAQLSARKILDNSISNSKSSRPGSPLQNNSKFSRSPEKILSSVKKVAMKKQKNYSSINED